MVLDGPGGEVELLGDLLVGTPPGGQQGDLPLDRGELGPGADGL